MLPPGAAFCLAPTEKPAGLSGDDYRRARALAAWALESLNKIIPAETIDGLDWRWLAEQAGRSPKNFLAAAAEFSGAGFQPASSNLAGRMPAPLKRSPICCAKRKPEKSSRAWSNGR